MLEGLAMCITLVAMGIYFIKSTDIPQDMRDRSAQLRSQSPEVLTAPKKYSFPIEKDRLQVLQEKQEKLLRVTQQESDEKLLEIKSRDRQVKIALLNKKIDETTLLITALEQELKENNEKNSSIQAQINRHLEILRTLKDTVIA